MKILIISFTNIENDARIKRHINTLGKYFQVDSCGYGKKPAGVEEHFELPERLGYLPTNLKSILLHFLGIYSWSYRNTSVVKWINSNLKEKINSYELIICNDVLTIGIPTLLEFEKSTYADLHEYSPKEFENDLRFIIFLKKYYEYLCKTYLSKFDFITSVSPSISREYSVQFSVNCEVLTNSKSFSSNKVKKTKSDKIKFVHAGLAVRNRKLDRLVKAFEGLEGVELDLYLVKSHRQPLELEKLKKLSRKSKNVRVCEAVPDSLLIEALHRYDVGLAFLPDKTFNLRHSLGNKIFEYIQARLCVIVGPSPDMANLVENYSLGLVTKSFSTEDLRRTVSSVSPEQIDFYKQNVDKAAFLLSYNVEELYLVNRVNALMSK